MVSDEVAQGLEERLREKYASGKVPAPSAGPVTGSGRAESDRSNGLHVHLCHYCKGEGKENTQYDSGRVIEKDCSECEGVGALQCILLLQSLVSFL